MSLKAIGLQCVDQQTDLLVFTEFQSDLREWSHWNVGGQRPILAPCIEIWRGIRPPCPAACSTPDQNNNNNNNSEQRILWFTAKKTTIYLSDVWEFWKYKQACIVFNVDTV